MALKHGLLGLLSYGEMTGYELGKAFGDSLSFFWQAQPSQIYRELNKMEELGWLSSRIQFQTDKPNRRFYAITGMGQGELARWLAAEPPREIMATRSETLMRLFFSAQIGRRETQRALEQIAQCYREQSAQMAALESIIEGYSARVEDPDAPLYWEMTADFGHAYNQMVLDWAQRCIRRLEKEPPAGGDGG